MIWWQFRIIWSVLNFCIQILIEMWVSIVDLLIINIKFVTQNCMHFKFLTLRIWLLCIWFFGIVFLRNISNNYLEISVRLIYLSVLPKLSQLIVKNVVILVSYENTRPSLWSLLIKYALYQGGGRGHWYNNLQPLRRPNINNLPKAKYATQESLFLSCTLSILKSLTLNKCPRGEITFRDIAINKRLVKCWKECSIL